MFWLYILKNITENLVLLYTGGNVTVFTDKEGKVIIKNNACQVPK